MKGGLTTKLLLFTNDQFDNVVTKFNALLLPSFSLLLASFVYYAVKDPHLIADETNERVVFAAGILGLVYASFLTVDCLFRSKVKEVRICSEIGIVCGFSSYWALVYVVFGKWLLLVLAVVMIFIGYGGYKFVKNNPSGGDGKIRGEATDPRLQLVLNRLGRKDDLYGPLHIATIAAILGHPEDPATETLFLATVAATPEVLVVESETEDEPPMKFISHHHGLSGSSSKPTKEVGGGSNTITGDIDQNTPPAPVAPKTTPATGGGSNTNTGEIDQNTPSAHPKTTPGTGGGSASNPIDDPKTTTSAPPPKPDSIVLGPRKDGGKSTSTGTTHSSDSSKLTKKNKGATEKAAATSTPSTRAASTTTPSTRITRSTIRLSTAGTATPSTAGTATPSTPHYNTRSKKKDAPN